MDEISNPGTTALKKGSHSSGGSGCRDICRRYKAPKPKGGRRYADGQKRCQICEVFFKTDDIWCICCGYRLRSKPRNSRYKNMLLKQKELKNTEEK